MQVVLSIEWNIINEYCKLTTLASEAILRNNKNNSARKCYFQWELNWLPMGFESFFLGCLKYDSEGIMEMSFVYAPPELLDFDDLLESVLS